MLNQSSRTTLVQVNFDEQQQTKTVEIKLCGTFRVNTISLHTTLHCIKTNFVFFLLLLSLAYSRQNSTHSTTPQL